MLVRNNALGASLAQKLGNHPVVLMRGHGSVAVGGSLPQVVFRAVYTEVNAKLQSGAMKLGPVTYLSPEEAEHAAATTEGRTARPWKLGTRKGLEPWRLPTPLRA